MPGQKKEKFIPILAAPIAVEALLLLSLVVAKIAEALGKNIAGFTSIAFPYIMAPLAPLAICSLLLLSMNSTNIRTKTTESAGIILMSTAVLITAAVLVPVSPVFLGLTIASLVLATIATVFTAVVHHKSGNKAPNSPSGEQKSLTQPSNAPAAAQACTAVAPEPKKGDPTARKPSSITHLTP